VIRLAGVESRRLFARRLTVIGVAAVLVVTAFLLFATWREARPPSAAQQVQAQQQFEQAQKDWQLHGAEYMKQCETNWKAEPDPKPVLADFCQVMEPKLDQFGKPKTVFAELMPNLLLGSSYLLAFVAFVIGASFVGAEFSSGAIGNWLTFEPRRLRVYGSKLIAAALGMVPLAVVVLAVLTAGTWLIVRHYGTVDSTTGKVWGDLAGTAGRSVALTAGAGALGGVAALLLRHTAAAIGVAMGYLVLVEGVFGGFLMKFQPWLVKANFDAWIAHGTSYYVEVCQTMSEGGYNCNRVEKTLSFEHGAWYLGILAVVLVAVGALVFNRRDVN
jgi:ABC-2 type transport system permease protein